LNEKEERGMKEKAMSRWIDFLSTHYAHPFSDSDGREKFLKAIKPDSIAKEEVPQYETDVKLLEQLKARQEGG
jgi:hypothetical protein